MNTTLTMRFIIAITVGALGGLLARAQSASPYELTWATIDGGGGASTGGVYSVSGTLGQPEAGAAMTNGCYELTGGLWGLFGASTDSVPALRITRSGGNLLIAWPVTSTSWVLQESSGLASRPDWVVWTDVAARAKVVDAENIVTQPAMSGSFRFFRLRCP